MIAAERCVSHDTDLDLHHPPDENQHQQPELLSPQTAPEEGGEGGDEQGQ